MTVLSMVNFITIDSVLAINYPFPLGMQICVVFRFFADVYYITIYKANKNFDAFQMKL